MLGVSVLFFCSSGGLFWLNFCNGILIMFCRWLDFYFYDDGFLFVKVFVDYEENLGSVGYFCFVVVVCNG